MAVLKLYNDIQTENEKNLCRWFGEAEGVCFKDVDEFLSQMEDGDDKIDLKIFCDGGSVLEGWAIYDKLRASGKEISATVEGKCASMATVILLAAPKERRCAYKSAQVCVHNPWVPGYSLGDTMTADDLQKAADRLKEQQEKILDLYVERCGCDREEMQALMDEDKFISADEAKGLGLIGEIIAPVSAKRSEGASINNLNKSSEMAEIKDEKIEVKASIWEKIKAKLGIEKAEDLEESEVMAMELSTASGGSVTIEREEGEPQVGDKASPDGEHKMPDGKTIVVKDGVITEIKPKDGEETDDEKDAKIESLEAQVADLTTKLEVAESKAKTEDEMRILNAVKIAGGEKALAKLSSNYKPQGRKADGGRAQEHAGEDVVSDMRAEIEARRNGTWKKEEK